MIGNSQNGKDKHHAQKRSFRGNGKVFFPDLFAVFPPDKVKRDESDQLHSDEQQFQQNPLHAHTPTMYAAAISAAWVYMTFGNFATARV